MKNDFIIKLDVVSQNLWQQKLHHLHDNTCKHMCSFFSSVVNLFIFISEHTQVTL